MANHDFLGYGLVRPFRRDAARDFLSAGGVELVQSTLGQALATMAASPVTHGEIPWRPGAGSLLHLLRHSNTTPATRQKAVAWCRDAARKWAPRVEVIDVTAVEPRRINELNRIVIKVVWKPIERDVPANQVALPPKTTEVVI